MNTRPVLIWFRLDLRLKDNPALWAAAQAEAPIIPVFVWAPEEEDPWPPGAASRWWLHHERRLKPEWRGVALIGQYYSVRRQPE